MEKSVELTLERIRLKLLLNNITPSDKLMGDIKDTVEGLYHLAFNAGQIDELKNQINGLNSSKTL